MRLPRFLWVPFELGRPFGAPHEPDFQRRVLRDALALVERTDGPVVLEDFPDDAPTSDHDVAWSCPVSFAPATIDESELVSAVRGEVRALAPWAELGTAPLPNTDLAPADLIGFFADAAETDDHGHVDIERFRLVADDLRTWYLHAVSQQPGRATSHDRSEWFWRQTALARLLASVAARLLGHPSPRVRVFAERGIVPRDHWERLVSNTPSDDPTTKESP